MFTVGRDMLGIQAHPEFEKDYNRKLIEIRTSRIGEQKASIGLQSLERELHGSVIREWVMNFILF